jgi:hypothetical protein
MNARTFLMAGGVAIAAWLALFGDKTPNGGIAEPVARSAGTPANASAARRTETETSEAAAGNLKRNPEIISLRPRSQLLGATLADIRPARNGAESLFGTQSWAPPPAPAAPAPAPPPPPSAPPVPFSFVGQKFENNKWEVYLARGENTYLVHEQSVVEGTYRIDSIKPPVLSLTYLPLKQVQTLTIGGID